MRVRPSRPTSGEPVAVVDIGCRFPGNVTGPESFWQLMADGVDTIEQVPPDRWDADAFYDSDSTASGRMTTKWGGFCSMSTRSDADFFGITSGSRGDGPAASDAARGCLGSVEHAGIPPDSLSGTRTGADGSVVVGLHVIVNIERRADIDAYSEH